MTRPPNTAMRPLSHSSMSMYLECPQKYKFKYIDKLPEKPKPFFSFGRSVHSALEFFYNVPSLPAPSLPEVLAHYRENWASEGYKDAQEEAKYLAEGERILREFYKKHIADFEIPFFAEYRFDLQIDGIPVTGFVDRVDKIGGDRIAIVDYKTGKAFGEDRVRTDAQLTLYQLACEELLGLKVDRLTFYHLNSLTPITVERHADSQVQDLKTRIVQVADFIQKGLFDPKPEERKCQWCDFKPFCPIYRSADAAFIPFPKNQVETTVQGMDDDLAVLVDRYGQMMDQASDLRSQIDELADAISDKLKEKGWVRAFGSNFEISMDDEIRWEFRDKTKVLDVIKKAGLWDDIVAPSAPLVQKLMRSPSLRAEVREKLEALGEKLDRPALRVKKIETVVS